MLDHETTIGLLRLAQKGDEPSKAELIKHNSPLIKSIIKRYLNKGVDYEDLYQLGCVGFLKAINNFSEVFNVKFSTYAVPMIAGEVKRFLRDDGSIKVSRALKGLSYQIQKFIDKKRMEDIEPSLEQIAEEFKISVAEVVFALDSSHMPISLNEKIDKDSSNSPSIIDKLSINSAGDEEQIDKILLKDIISTLSIKDKKIIILRYFRDMTQSEVAKLLNVSQVQVSRLENKIIERMKKKLLVVNE